MVEPKTESPKDPPPRRGGLGGRKVKEGRKEGRSRNEERKVKEGRKDGRNVKEGRKVVAATVAAINKDYVCLSPSIYLSSYLLIYLPVYLNMYVIHTYIYIYTHTHTHIYKYVMSLSLNTFI